MLQKIKAFLFCLTVATLAAAMIAGGIYLLCVLLTGTFNMTEYSRGAVTTAFVVPFANVLFKQIRESGILSGEQVKYENG